MQWGRAVGHLGDYGVQVPGHAMRALRMAETKKGGPEGPPFQTAAAGRGVPGARQANQDVCSGLGVSRTASFSRIRADLPERPRK